jgi:hypothetical protein
MKLAENALSPMKLGGGETMIVSGIPFAGI